LASLSDTQHTQGIIALAERPAFSLPDLWPSQGQAALVIAFDRVQDPGNFGTLVRTAEAAGANGIIALAGCADAYSPKTLRSAMGSAFRLPIISSASIDELFAGCSERCIQIIAAAGAASMAHTNYDWTQPTLLLLGNEARGVSDGLLSRCDAQIRIPMRPPVESLNVAAAGAVLLFEAARQRSGSEMTSDL
jgi:TrmH family RNA methyltransferase